MLLMFRVLGRSSTVIVGALSLDAVSGKIEVEKTKLVLAVAFNLLEGLLLIYVSQLYELTQLSHPLSSESTSLSCLLFSSFPYTVGSRNSSQSSTLSPWFSLPALALSADQSVSTLCPTMQPVQWFFKLP